MSLTSVLLVEFWYERRCSTECSLTSRH